MAVARSAGWIAVRL